MFLGEHTESLIAGAKLLFPFAGGLPAPETFPIEKIKEANKIVLEENGRKALQYSTTEGFNPLRKWIGERIIKGIKIIGEVLREYIIR